MSRFLGCGCNQRSQSELHPTVWAGCHNEWKRVLEMTDEFRSTTLNKTKWLPYSPFSFGTKPGLFVPSNVFVRQRTLHLTAKNNGAPKAAPPGHVKWTTAAVVSQAACLYGYIECCFRASNSALASRFSLIGQTPAEDVDVGVFSYASTGKHKEIVYMDARLRRSNAFGKEEAIAHPLKKVIFDMPEHPVTVGIDWTPDYLKTYVDGHVIRDLKNRHWHTPMHISFQLDTSPKDFGMPSEGERHMRNDFEVYYIRTWQRTLSERQEAAAGISRDYA